MIKEIESHSLEDYLLKEKNLQNENGITDAVREIIQEVKDSRNEALLKFINKHEGRKLKSIDEVLFNQDFLEDKFNSLSDKDRNMLIYMADRIEKFHNKDIRLFGPLSPDSCWNSSVKAWNDKNAEKHDGILAMYHDQGLIPMKVIALNYSVNTTIGLPFIRTSPDHGTGFDIAGKGIAQSQSMIEAIKAAVEMTNNSRLLNTH